ncbi:cytochrome c oxidase accessory protein CcoG [Litoribrevibacter albus]|uniref:Iron-sulfur protein n=1 Tax=Litoribrevibacter albus TaxID=1473156 RepID=A0AA37S778_9GAMM|nr:cytochrome c oxidase accessory protein CcoG [Litoribrevibacter albus]GLQ29739.1 iron-sulfur protein [Litoribrevibacter albus]
MTNKIELVQIEPDHKDVHHFNPDDNVIAREKIQVKATDGFHSKLRKLVAGLGFLAFFGCAWLQWDGHQAVLWDLTNRQFLIFGLTLWPQDLFLLSFTLMISAFGLFAVTAFAGRVWCGYACPQSTWSWVFIWLENKIEGDRNARRKLDKASLSSHKVFLKLVKHASWAAVAFITALTFVGYFTPIRELASDLFTFEASWGAVSWVLILSVLTYLNAGWLREQVCIYMCPYARFQSVMFDKDTLVVSYDVERGEPRSAKRKHVQSAEEKPGDCVDCTLCVQVCPTGIDIRQGLQYECISCGKCIDACNNVMDKLGFARGLIRYTSETALKHKQPAKFHGRLLGYSAVMTVLLGALVYGVMTLSTVDLEVDRGRGANLFRENYRGDIINSYNVRVMNKTQETKIYQLAVEGVAVDSLEGTTTLELAPGEISQLPMSVTVKLDQLSERATPIEFVVWEEGNPLQRETAESRFIAPLR